MLQGSWLGVRVPAFQQGRKKPNQLKGKSGEMQGAWGDLATQEGLKGGMEHVDERQSWPWQRARWTQMGIWEPPENTTDLLGEAEP